MRRKKSQTTTRTERRPLAVVILAAGDGKRMRSHRPKVLHELAGKPLLLHVLDAARALRPSRAVVVVGKSAKEVVAAAVDGESVVVQEPRLGTGHAVLQARRALAGFRGDVLVLSGDVPLLRASTLTKLLHLHRRADASATVLSMIAAEPAGYGRVVRDGSGGIRIVEHADATPDERNIDEVNTGTYCFNSTFLFASLGKLGRKNVQREYYLTDLVAVAARGGRARCHVLDDADEGLGVNSRLDLACAEAALQERLIAEWMDKGVTFLDPSSAYLGADVRLGMDVSIGPSVVLLGRTEISEGARIDGASRISDTVVGAGAHVRWGVVADGARIATDARVGPYAHLRPGASLGDSVHIGNFVEVKNATLGRGSKANHLAYIGDATVGRDANIGAGTITCNYDGFRKHRTVIGDRVQIGSDTQLVAPVTLGADSYVAAGSTVSRDVPAGALAFNDKQQMTRPNWVRAFRKRATGEPLTKRRNARSKS